MGKQFQAGLMLHTYMDEEGQPENWQFVLTADGPEDENHSAGMMEEQVKEYLQKFQGCVLPKTPPFDRQEAGPQSIAEYFWEPMRTLLLQDGFHLSCLYVERSDGANFTARQKSLALRQTALVVQPQLRMPEKERMWPVRLLSILLLALCAAGMGYWIWHAGGGRPMGQQIWEHLYGGDFSGYNPAFFSLFASPAPLPYAIYTACLAITGGVQNAYFTVLVLLYLTGVAGWMIWGRERKNLLLSAVLAAAWFASPQMLYILFVQGNLPLALCLSGVPYLLYCIYDYLDRRTLRCLYGMSFCMLCMVLSHPVAAAVALGASALFLGLYGLMNRDWKRPVMLVVWACTGVLLSGFWLVPALLHGTVTVQDEGMLDSVLVALYPAVAGRSGALYIGLAVFGVAVFGALCSNWRRAAGFWAAAVGAIILIFLHYTLLLMAGMTVLLGLVAASLLRWHPCPRWVLLVCAGLLLVDGVFAYHGTQPWTDAQQQVALPQQSQEQWISVLGNVTPADGTYVIQNRRMRVDRKQRMEEAFEAGHFYYVFDRSLESGAGTVLMEQQKVPPLWMDKLMDAATKSGYRYDGQMQGALVFHQQTPKQFGTTANYQAIGIGTTAYLASWLFPDMQEGASPYPEDYSLERLGTYKTVYLSGWKVRDREKLEELLTKLHDRGVQVVAEAGNGPALFGAQTEEVMLTGVMPALEGAVTVPALPISAIARGIMLKNPDETWIWAEKDSSVSVAGTKGPVRLLGIQLASFAAKESRVEYLPVLEEMLGLHAGEQPQRKVQDVTYDRRGGKMTVQGSSEGIILPVTYTGPVKVCGGEAGRVHGLIQMKTKTVVLKASYSNAGMAMTGAGLLLALGYMIFVRKRRIAPRDANLVKFEL